MKIIATSDVHQMISKWKELVEICKKEKPDVVAIAGDLMPKDNGILAQLSFIKPLRKYAEQIKEVGSQIVIVLGNDDNQNMIPEMERAHKDGLWHYIPEKVVEIGGYEFAAMPYVPDYPFGYKFWCRAESIDNIRLSQQQFSEPLLIDGYNKFRTIERYSEYLASKKSIWDSLKDTAAQVKNIRKSIWLIHAPPANCMLDVCSHGARVGSFAVLKFIMEYQPLLTIHGHIHESPEYTGHNWCCYKNDTLCIQGGQLGFNLHYATIEIEDGKIINKKHSIYHGEKDA
jgi:Icc-related predicted phosphoesterase